MKRSLMMVMLTALAACGADGEPVQPFARSSVNISNHGVGLGATLGFGDFPLTLNLGTTL